MWLTTLQYIKATKTEWKRTSFSNFQGRDFAYAAVSSGDHKTSFLQSIFAIKQIGGTKSFLSAFKSRPVIIFVYRYMSHQMYCHESIV